MCWRSYTWLRLVVRDQTVCPWICRSPLWERSDPSTCCPWHVNSALLPRRWVRVFYHLHTAIVSTSANVDYSIFQGNTCEATHVNTDDLPFPQSHRRLFPLTFSFTSPPLIAITAAFKRFEATNAQPPARSLTSLGLLRSSTCCCALARRVCHVVAYGRWHMSWTHAVPERWWKDERLGTLMWFALECKRVSELTDNYVRITAPRASSDPRLWNPRPLSVRRSGSMTRHLARGLGGLLHKTVHAQVQLLKN